MALQGFIHLPVTGGARAWFG